MKSRMMLFTLGLLSLTTFLTPASLGAAEPAQDPDEKLLRDAGIGISEHGLAEFWRQCAKTDHDWHRAKKLIRQLGDKDFAVRKKASDELVKLGPVADDLLWEARNDADPEVARRAGECGETILRQHPAGSVWPDRIWRTEERRAALRLVARHESPLVVPAFVCALTSPEPHNREVNTPNHTLILPRRAASSRRRRCCARR